VGPVAREIGAAAGFKPLTELLPDDAATGKRLERARLSRLGFLGIARGVASLASVILLYKQWSALVAVAFWAVVWLQSKLGLALGALPAPGLRVWMLAALILVPFVVYKTLEVISKPRTAMAALPGTPENQGFRVPETGFEMTSSQRHVRCVDDGGSRTAAPPFGCLPRDPLGAHLRGACDIDVCRTDLLRLAARHLDRDRRYRALSDGCVFRQLRPLLSCGSEGGRRCGNFWGPRSLIRTSFGDCDIGS
jgi:hypothetical protein